MVEVKMDVENNTVFLLVIHPFNGCYSAILQQQQLGYEEVSAICKDVLEETIGVTGYQHGEAVKW